MEQRLTAKRRVPGATPTGDDTTVVDHIGRVELETTGQLQARLVTSDDRPATKDPRQKLPVAARPAVVAQGGDIVAGGKLLNHLDVRSKTCARKHSLEQIVAKDHGIGHPAGERRLKGIEVVYALAGVGAFSEEILVNVGDSGSVGVDAARTREHALEK